MKWHIEFFDKNVKDETFSFPKGILAKFLYILELIEEIGVEKGEPYIKPLSDGLLK